MGSQACQQPKLEDCGKVEVVVDSIDIQGGRGLQPSMTNAFDLDGQC